MLGVGSQCVSKSSGWVVETGLNDVVTLPLFFLLLILILLLLKQNRIRMGINIQIAPKTLQHFTLMLLLWALYILTGVKENLVMFFDGLC
jgi:hypothetical protein